MIDFAANRSGSQLRPNLLEVGKLTVTYGQSTAVRSVSLRVPEGGAVAVLGPNGAGKSSLARGISGLVRPASGSVRFGDRELVGLAPYRIRQLGLAYLPEGRGVFPALSVKENFRMAVRKSAKNEAREGVNLATTLFPVLSERMNQVAGTLSGGEQQMLALGSALATRPALLIADELSLGLAPKVVDSVFESLWEARRLGIGVVLIEQFVGRALNFCDEALVLRRGTIVWSGDADGAHESVAAKYIS